MKGGWLMIYDFDDILSIKYIYNKLRQKNIHTHKINKDNI